MANGAPPVVLETPPVTAAAPRLSLVSMARTPPAPTDGHWQSGGVTYAPEGCANHGAIDACSNASFGSAQPSNLPIALGHPFVVWAADECSTFGFASRDWQGRATRQLLAATPFEVEHEFWTGTLSKANSYGNRFLADDTAPDAVVNLTPAGGAVSPLDGLACLEQALAGTGYGAQGMIHMTRKPAILLSQFLRREGNSILTDVDTVVVPGVGYPGTAPDGTNPAAGEAWMYATDYVSVFLGDPQTFGPGETGLSTQYGVLDPTVNTLRYRAERAAAVTFDGCRHFAIRVQVPSCGGGF